ncbi:hypothetical protein [Undibacterium sp. TS12]|uniref:hypothetical protein n=1 Tax=Undibacterium sp. TS12 TaxID=2908202 RepID=UPI001F4C890F|nr:hypothetical protein [Undibacterium sp. TS12]MCH8623009.1 hypothetical protein [Undibacterium sp. TS12]
MKTIAKPMMIRALTCIALINGAMMTSYAQSAESNQAVTRQSDPARWYQEETTPMAYFKTLKTEAQAVYQESSRACRREPRTQVQACLREARNTLQQDMTAAYRKSGMREK